MIQPYQSLPGSAVDRPFLDVLMGASGHRVRGLVDSGAVHGLFHPDIATDAGIDLRNAEEREIVHGPGRASRAARFSTVSMEAVGGRDRLHGRSAAGLGTSWPDGSLSVVHHHVLRR